MPRFQLIPVILLGIATSAVANDIDDAPIRYSTTKPNNAVSQLQQQLDAGREPLKFVDDHGYLPSVLKALNVPVSSQVLVFSKTSFQRERIGPKTPRAIYFNDETYVGFCLRGDVLEFSATDPQLGTVFYSLEQESDQTPRFRRHTENCLICHGSSRTQGFPGHLVRSVTTDRLGMPILSSGSKQTDHSSPISERWGGWYVTGTHGKQQDHMGNWIVQNSRNPQAEENVAGQNVTELKSRFTVGNYLSPHSDIVALMVLEHQIEGHNRITRANMLTRQALYQETELNRELKEPVGKRWESTTRRIRAAGEPLVEYLLFSEEAKLTDPVKGTSAFTEEFAKRGPFDRSGRSVREFDLKTRLFRYPCSYLIYTPAFDAMPTEVRDYVLRRMWDVLSGADASPKFAHLSATDRRNVREILRETKPKLPDYWKRD